MHSSGILFILVGLGLAVYGHIKLDQIRKYEFENRSSGGTVKFENYKAAKSHGRKTTLWDLVRGGGVALLLIGLCLKFI